MLHESTDVIWVHHLHHTGSFVGIHCFQDLQSVLQDLPDEQLIQMAQQYIPTGRLRRLRDRMTRIHMIDSVASVNSVLSQTILTDLLILVPNPDVDLVLRILTLSVGEIVPHSQV